MRIQLVIHKEPDHKLININVDNLPIYRVIEISHLLDIFETNTITLVPPRMWDDPYENVFADSFGKVVSEIIINEY